MIYFMYSNMNCSKAFFHWKNHMLWFMFISNIPNLHRLKLDFSLLPWLHKQPKNFDFFQNKCLQTWNRDLHFLGCLGSQGSREKSSFSLCKFGMLSKNMNHNIGFFQWINAMLWFMFDYMSDMGHNIDLNYCRKTRPLFFMKSNISFISLGVCSFILLISIFFFFFLIPVSSYFALNHVLAFLCGWKSFQSF